MNVHKQLCTPTGVQEAAKEWWDCNVSTEIAEKLSAKYVKQRKKPMEASIKTGSTNSALAGGHLVWLKNMLNEAGLLPVSGSPPPDDKAVAVTAVLHVGFITLAETEKMIERLQNEEQLEETNAPARSKIFKTAQKQTITPIDATASIVTHSTQEDK
jgi:hypothetical protein